LVWLVCDVAVISGQIDGHCTGFPCQEDERYTPRFIPGAGLQSYTWSCIPELYLELDSRVTPGVVFQSYTWSCIPELHLELYSRVIPGASQS